MLNVDLVCLTKPYTYHASTHYAYVTGKASRHHVHIYMFHHPYILRQCSELQNNSEIDTLSSYDRIGTLPCLQGWMIQDLYNFDTIEADCPFFLHGSTIHNTQYCDNFVYSLKMNVETMSWHIQFPLLFSTKGRRLGDSGFCRDHWETV